MNIDEWMRCVSKAYEVTGKKFSAGIKSALLKKLPTESIYRDCSTKGAIEQGVIAAVPPQFEMQTEAAQTEEVMRRRLFWKATCGETFGLISRVEQKFGRSTIGRHYQLKSGPFLDLAKAFWTYKIEMGDLFPGHYDLVLAQVLARVEGAIGSVFFPMPGPVVMWVRQRRQQQRQMLEVYAPNIDVKSLLENNPLLGTSKGRISERIFEERIIIRCSNPDCSRLIAIPNTIKGLTVRCRHRGCKASFRFPVRDFEWLDHVRPDAHPDISRVDQLEDLRRSYNIPHPVFAWWVIGSPWTTQRIQESIYMRVKKAKPQALEKEILKDVFKTRAFAWPPVPVTTEEEIDKAMESIDSLEDLVGYFIREEAKEIPSPDPFGIGSMVDDILSV